MNFTAFIKALVDFARRPDAVSVREAHFGYIISSAKLGPNAEFQNRIADAATAMFWVAAFSIWVLPGGQADVVTSSVISLVMFGAGVLTLKFARLPGCMAELHVDTARREVRSAVVSDKGKRKICNIARFGEIAEPVLRQGKPGTSKRFLSLRIVGTDQEMPVAAGTETILLAIHDRIMRDMRPLEQQMGAFQMQQRPTRIMPRPAFAPLGPVEIAA